MSKTISFYFALFFVVIITACSNSTKTTVQKKSSKHGGILYVNELSSFKNLYPLSVTETTSHRIGSQIYEGLVKLSQKDLSIQPALAKNWTVNENATVFTFNLRKGVFFHEDKCFGNSKTREVNIHDIKFALNKLCNYDAYNSGFSFVQDRIKGAKTYYNATKQNQLTKNEVDISNGVEGVKVLNDSTIQIELNYPFAGFLNILATPFCWIYPKEALDFYGTEMRAHCVGTGPFILKHVTENESVVLVNNKKYWKKTDNQIPLPYLDAIKISFIKEKESEYLDFVNGKLHLLSGPPAQHIEEVMDTTKTKNYEVQIVPSLSINYYGYLTTDPIFQNKKLRQAINYAIDRDKIVKYTLKGASFAAHNGIVPPAFKNYPAVNGYRFNTEKAKKLLTEAGYPNGKGLSGITLNLNSGGAVNSEIAEVVRNMIEENLNLKVKLNVVPWIEHLQKVQSGQSSFFRSGWMADYPDPENFLSLLYGKLVPKNKNEESYQNSTRYKNKEFDKLYEQALKEVDNKKRMKLYAKAEQIAMDDAPMILLNYGKNIRLVKKEIKGLTINPMEYRDFTEVYIQKN